MSHSIIVFLAKINMFHSHLNTERKLEEGDTYTYQKTHGRGGCPAGGLRLRAG